jgi:predicted O-linked N-acetylglucosamine transferase (SPINDLY family)
MVFGFLNLLRAMGAQKAASAQPTEALGRARLLWQEGRLASAIAVYEAILAADPDQWEALNGRAAVTLQAGELERAIQLYDALILRRQDAVEAHYKRANALNGLGRWEEALAGYDRAIALEPTHANAFCNRGAVLERLHRSDDALASYDRALALNSNDALAYYNRASVLRAMKRFDEALVSYEQAIARKTDYVEAYINRGHVLQELRRHEAAVESYDRAIELDASYVEAFQGRGLSLLGLGRPEAAISSYNQALALNADQKYLLGLRRHAQMQICDWDGLSDDLARLAAGLQAGRAVSTPFPMLSLVDSVGLHRSASEIWVREECPPNDALGAIAARPATEKIRIGYFSADFRDHPVAMLTAELFESHDRSKFEIIAFAFGPEANGDMRARLERAFDRFIDVRARSDLEVAALAREMRIDIAVDLGGFTEHSRAQIFALRAAPIQVNYLGFPGTLGADYMDYLVGDQLVVPESHQHHFAEKIVYLPNSYLPGYSQRPISDAVFARADLGLPPSGFVFCCFNNSFKITPDTFDSWMRILNRVEKGVLWLSQGSPAVVSNLRKEAARRGIAPERLVFAARMPSVEDHLGRHRAADLFLDTLPYNAHATAIDALWAGLPVLTLTGNAFAGRVGASLLTAIGLPELIAATPADYEDLAVSLAADAPRLASIKEKLARNRAVAPLFDPRRFTRNLERAYTQMVMGYRTGAPATDMALADEV